MSDLRSRIIEALCGACRCHHRYRGPERSVAMDDCPVHGRPIQKLPILADAVLAVLAPELNAYREALGLAQKGLQGAADMLNSFESAKFDGYASDDPESLTSLVYLWAKDAEDALSRRLHSLAVVKITERQMLFRFVEEGSE